MHMWTSGDVKAAIDRELGKLESTKLQELPGLLERVRRIGSDHGHSQLAEEAVGRVRSMLPTDLLATPIRLEPVVTQLIAVLKKCDACKFEWSAAKDEEPCPLCRLLVAENKVRSLGVLEDGELWIGKLAHACLASLAGPGPRLTLLGFDQQIDGEDRCGSFDVVARAQMRFQPLLLIVAPECEDGVLLDIKVGSRSQRSNFTPVALSLYKPQSWADVAAMEATMLVQCDVACAAQDVTVTVSLARRGRFRAVIVGRMDLEPPKLCWPKPCRCGSLTVRADVGHRRVCGECGSELEYEPDKHGPTHEMAGPFFGPR